MLLHIQIVLAASNGSLDQLHKEENLLLPAHRKAVRKALAYLTEVQDPDTRNRLFCFLWEKSGHAWDIPVTMTCIKG